MITNTIGVIDSPDALGLIRFNKDFLELRPDFKDVAVVSYFDTCSLSLRRSEVIKDPLSVR